jgi:hypothetical protein
MAVVMENTIIMTAAVAFLAIAACLYPLLAVAWASVAWTGLHGGVVITLFWVRFGPAIHIPFWPPRQA